MVTTSTPPLVLRSMQAEDVPAVHALDRAAFPNPWPVSTYHHELSAASSKLFVLELAHGPTPSRLSRVGLLQRIRQFAEIDAGQSALIGFSGMWHVADEAHISTIAIRPDWQGNKLGELLLWNMARHALHERARILTLEVRVTNYRAQALYRKYHFVIMGRRKGYYRDNGEDAYLMGVDPLDDGYYRLIASRGQALGAQFTLDDRTSRV